MTKLKTKPIMFPPIWEYNIKSYENWKLASGNDPSVVKKDGWEAISTYIDPLFPEHICVLYKRQVEEDEDPWNKTYEKWMKNKKKLSQQLDVIKNNIPKLYSSMDDYYKSNKQSFWLWQRAHALTDGFNCINSEPGAYYGIIANDAEQLFLALNKLQKETHHFNALIKLLKEACDYIFYTIIGYDIRDAAYAPDILNYFFGSNLVGRLLRLRWLNLFLAAIIYTFPIAHCNYNNNYYK